MSLTNKILRFINWLFAILFTFSGLVLTTTYFKNATNLKIDLNSAIVIAIAGLLISPYVSDLLKKSLNITISLQDKIILILLSIVITVFSIQEDIGLMIASNVLSNSSEAQKKAFAEAQKEKKSFEERKIAFLASRNQLLFQLQTLYDSGDYQEVVTQGTPILEFDTTVKGLVYEAQQKLDDQQIEKARTEAPQLLADGKFYEAYQMARKFVDDPQLKNIALEAKKKGDEEMKKLLSLYETGQYDKLIAQGAYSGDFDCRVKGLVSAAELAKTNKEERKRADDAYKTATKHLKEHHFEKAYETAKNFSTDADLQEIARQAKEEIDKAKEKKILSQLKEIPSTSIEQLIDEYNKLIEISPDNLNYQNKLKFYREKLAKSNKSSPNLVTRKEYGDQWPFTVAYGELSCLPPGLVTLWVNEKTYALNELATSRGIYTKIDEILKNPQVDITPIRKKGELLCQIRKP